MQAAQAARRLVHEKKLAARAAGPEKLSKAALKVDHASDARLSRTLFVGNVPVGATALKLVRRVFRAFGTVESVPPLR